MKDNFGLFATITLLGIGLGYVCHQFGFAEGESQGRFKLAQSKITEVDNLHWKLLSDDKMSQQAKYDEMARLVRSIENNFLPILVSDVIVHGLVKSHIEGRLNNLIPM